MCGQTEEGRRAGGKGRELRRVPEGRGTPGRNPEGRIGVRKRWKGRPRPGVGSVRRPSFSDCGRRAVACDNTSESSRCKPDMHSRLRRGKRLMPGTGYAVLSRLHFIKNSFVF
ncbi:MAG: hypothetical protein DBY37_00395 [Desulfovibrionaceae bacterium]|nr:MAG: hypothetical protein DBY37_00395 [Desulfovibrionaceae bacterium]